MVTGVQTCALPISIWTGAKNVKFTNSTPYTALLQAWVGDGQVHVRLWSTPYYEVTITSGEKTNIQPTAPVQGPAEGCEPYKGGNDGFDIVVTRKRSVNGQALPDERTPSGLAQRAYLPRWRWCG